MSYEENTGFTLMELVAVVVIVAVLAAIGLPQFMKTKERALEKEAITNLRLIAAAQKIYRLETDSHFYPVPAATEGDVDDINSYLRLSITEMNWNYSITSTGSPPSNYTSTATRVAGTYANCTYVVNNTYEEPVTSTCP